jgi:hypothetical protein
MVGYVEDGTGNVVNTPRNDPEERRSHVLRGGSPISLVKFRYLLLKFRYLLLKFMYLLLKLALYFLQIMIAIQASLVIRDLTLRVFAITRFKGGKKP